MSAPWCRACGSWPVLRGDPIAGCLSRICDQPSVAGASLVFSKMAICYLAQGLAPSRVGTDPAGTSLSIALTTDAIGLIDCMLSAITSQGWTLLVLEPLERPRKVDDSLVFMQYTMKSKSI